MSSINGWEIAGLAILAYALIVFALYRSGRIGADRAISLFGPALMIKTRKGRDLLDRLGRFRRFWSIVGDVGIILAAAAMVSIVILLVLDAIIAFRLTPAQAPSPQEALGIPGINPIIPLGYGIIALVVGIVLHELMHGILARSQRIGVKSLGMLWLVVPIGAFVEQDDEEMLKAPRRNRDRVAAAGVLANFVLAVVFAIALAVVISSSVAPNANGVGVAYVVPGTPAQNVSLAAGDIITDINGTQTTTNSALLNYLASTTSGQHVSVTFYDASLGRTITKGVTLGSSPMNSSRGFLGISPTFLTPTQLKGELISPLSSSSGPLIGGTDWIVLPLAGLEPLSGSSLSFYHLTGPLSGADTTTFWIGVNVLYWLAWMNLLLGVSNALPLFPLDGGLLFRDFTASFVSRVKKGWDANRLDRFAGQAAAASSVVVLVLLLWQFIVPRL